ncbi:hypothetical protein PDESU_05730 [Pontiella desulfatans]|uniref:Uncharacterized protein n=1 Tax=Pontiella desulfatans TaxID=2750659 RepID=A0A6C2UAU3_PONDE|nr:hypothetical protein PDESU_05730 [Pontiella desulfatans]
MESPFPTRGVTSICTIVNLDVTLRGTDLAEDQPVASSEDGDIDQGMR